NVKGPFALPSSMNLTCSLYTQQGVFVKNLTGCKVAPSDKLVKNATYTLVYSGEPNEFQSAIYGNTTFKTAIKIPTCQVDGYDGKLVSADFYNTIGATFVNQDSVKYYYR